MFVFYRVCELADVSACTKNAIELQWLLRRSLACRRCSAKVASDHIFYNQCSMPSARFKVLGKPIGRLILLIHLVQQYISHCRSILHLPSKAGLIVKSSLPIIRRILACLTSLFLMVPVACSQPTLDDLWQGKAHLEPVGELDYGGQHDDGVPKAASAWYAVADGRWYAFSRFVRFDRPADCPHDYVEIRVSESRDKGRTWSEPVVAVSPGASRVGDGCIIMDGNSFYDRTTQTWHMLAQCMDRSDRGGWAICHYFRRAPTPMGPYVPDSNNPVIRGGQLWQQVCTDRHTTCEPVTKDEGTPDIVEKRNGEYIVTFHGFDGQKGYRMVAATPDFRRWSVRGSGLPGAAILTAAECRTWLSGCVGFGQASALRSGGRIYVIAESMDRSLQCEENQKWTFSLLRSRGDKWPVSGANGWEIFRINPLIKPAQYNPKTKCQVNYARWLTDNDDTYIVYEDWTPQHKRVHRRLLKLVDGPT
ncbi:hypothetical protein ACQKE8_14860 [Sphingobium limneticum]